MKQSITIIVLTLLSVFALSSCETSKKTYRLLRKEVRKGDFDPRSIGKVSIKPLPVTIREKPVADTLSRGNPVEDSTQIATPNTTANTTHQL